MLKNEADRPVELAEEGDLRPSFHHQAALSKSGRDDHFESFPLKLCFRCLIQFYPRCTFGPINCTFDLSPHVWEPDENDPEEEAEEEGVEVEADNGVTAEVKQLAPNKPAHIEVKTVMVMATSKKQKHLLLF